MQYLPEPEERQWLIRYLRKLIERAGHEHFVSAPILEPMRTWFPERWSATVRDAHVVMQRLMHYAGLGALRARLEEFEAEDEGAEEVVEGGEPKFDTAAWFAGIRDGRAYFGIRDTMLDDPEKAAGALAHELAHAWRAQQRLVVEDAPDREEMLTDVTTIYLGFGIFTTNNTDRYRAAGDVGVTAWSFYRAGYLPMQAMAFLLALQAAARGDRDEIAAIERHLEPNQRRAFTEALGHFEKQDVPALLGLPPRETWPERQRRPRAIAVYEPGEDDVLELEADDDPQWNAGYYVYPHIVDRRAGTLALGLITAMLVMLALIRVREVGTPAVLFVLGVLIAAALVTRHLRRFVCSDEACRHPLTRNHAACPGCGGMLARDAEDALEKNAAVDEDLSECPHCAPEEPCEAHG